jgi:hypothetical protein
MNEEEFERVVVEAFKPVHEALGEALGHLAERDILARVYFNAREDIFLVWLEKPESAGEGGEHDEEDGFHRVPAGSDGGSLRGQDQR